MDIADWCEVIPGLVAHASGALWLPNENTLLVADVHLGYAWAQRRRGQLGPLTDGEVADKLLRVIDEFRPGTLVVLGDLVHAPRPSDPERAVIEQCLNQILARTSLTLVAGNHDRGFAQDFAGSRVRLAKSWKCPGVIACHGHSAGLPHESEVLLLGHFHPSVSVYDAAGATVRVPAFLVWPKGVVLPAFSPFSAGFNARRGLPAGLRLIMGKTSFRTFAASGRHIRQVGL